MRMIRILLPMAIIAVILSYMIGYRFTSESAAKAHSLLDKDAKLVQKIQSGMGDVYVYSNKDYYLTILPERQGLLYRASSSFTTEGIQDKSDKVRTIGWISSQVKKRSGTVMVIDILDDHVAYIEAGPESERVRKMTTEGGYLVFEWNSGYSIQELNPEAFSEKGEKLYYYGYHPQMPNVQENKDLRWHKVPE